LPRLIEFDGDAQTVSPSNKLLYLDGHECPHFADLSSLGDPLWTGEKLHKRAATAKN
jgi:hypothetical protein